MVIQDPRQNLTERTSKRLQIKPVTTIKGDAVLIFKSFQENNHILEPSIILLLLQHTNLFLSRWMFYSNSFLSHVEDSVGMIPSPYSTYLRKHTGFGGRGSSQLATHD